MWGAHDALFSEKPDRSKARGREFRPIASPTNTPVPGRTFPRVTMREGQKNSRGAEHQPVRQL